MIIFTLPMQVRQVAVANWIGGFILEKNRRSCEKKLARFNSLDHFDSCL